MAARSAVITGTGSSVPERVVTNQDLEKLVETSDDWIVARTGIRERRVAAPGEGVSKYAAAASRCERSAAARSAASGATRSTALLSPARSA